MKTGDLKVGSFYWLEEEVHRGGHWCPSITVLVKITAIKRCSSNTLYCVNRLNFVTGELLEPGVVEGHSFASKTSPEIVRGIIKQLNQRLKDFLKQ